MNNDRLTEIKNVKKMQEYFQALPMEGNALELNQ
jgi:hypothetical protein